MRLDIFSDVICPWCYIGKRRLERALALRPDAQPAIRWRAFQLNPDMPSDGMDRQVYLRRKFGGEARARQVYDNIRTAAEGESLEFCFERIRRTPNTVKAHRLIRYATDQGVADAVVEALFAAYFREGRDIGDVAELVALAEECGLDNAAVAEWMATEDGTAEVQAETHFAYQNGIHGVPCFIVNGKYAVSGAQEPEAFMPLFDLARETAEPALRAANKA